MSESDTGLRGTEKDMLIGRYPTSIQKIGTSIQRCLEDKTSKRYN